MKIAVLGGSFNPIHMGHLHLAHSVLSLCAYDRIIIVPANISPFKQNQKECPGKKNQGQTSFASSRDRLDMIAASIKSDPRIIIDDLELQRGGVSYTIDTIKEIKSRYGPSGKPGLVLGDDLVPDFFKWKNADELSRIADIIIARRHTSSQKGESIPDFPYPHKVLKNELMDISSALVREYIESGISWQHLVPEGARCIIQERGLFLSCNMI